MAASLVLLLASVGLFLSAQAQNCSRPVGGDHMDLKDTDILLQTFLDGIKVTFACVVGYVSVGGSPSITCTAGDWSSLKMTCERKSCGAFGDVPNGQVDYSGGIQFGDKLKVTCDPGYDLVGKSIIQCGNEGWMDRIPVCEVKHCDPPVDPTIGSFSPVKDTYKYRDVIEFSCPEHFTLNGSKSLSCSETGVFHPAAPKCVKVECQEPVVVFGHWESGSRGPYTHKATVTFKCNEGYRMTNSATITCGINSRWEPALPICEEVPAVQTTTTKSPESTKKPTAVPAVQTTTTKKPTAPAPPAPGPTAGGESLSTGAGLGVAIAVIALVAAAVAVCLWWRGFLKCSKEKPGSGTGDACAVPREEDVELCKRVDAARP